MMVTKRNIYNPFLNGSLGFLIHLKSGTHSEEMFTNVNLYWQPVQDPTIGLLFLVIQLLVILAGSFVHCHLWKMLNREESLVSNILKAYVIVQMIVWPWWASVRSVSYFTFTFAPI